MTEQLKKCSTCREEKSYSDFYKSKKSADGYCYTCKQCSQKRVREWSLKNPERKNAIRRRNYEENKERYLQISVEWNRTHRDKHVESNRKWRLKNPEKYLALARKHDLIKKDRLVNAGEIPTTEQIRELIIQSRKHCFWCDKIVKDKDLNIDHLYPLAKGGTNNINNLVVSCGLCNRRKHAKHPEQFMNEILNA